MKQKQLKVGLPDAGCAGRGQLFFIEVSITKLQSCAETRRL
jgi:hypothetical protein